MSKIFNISGNFKKGGKWAEPEPYFTGEILVDSDGTFYGYSVEPKETKYLVGVITEDQKKGRTDVQFYIMSNESNILPVFYSTHGKGGNLTGRWHEMERQLNSNHMCSFIPKGGAKVVVEKQPYSKKAENRIKTNFSKLKTGTVINGRIINSILEFS